MALTFRGSSNWAGDRINAGLQHAPANQVGVPALARLRRKGLGPLPLSPRRRSPPTFYLHLRRNAIPDLNLDTFRGPHNVAFRYDTYHKAPFIAKGTTSSPLRGNQIRVRLSGGAC